MTIKRAATSGRGVAHGLAVAIGIPPELAVSVGERAVAAMMALKQARDAGGGALRGQHLQRAQQHIAALDPARHGTLARHLQAHALALQGRGGDTRIAHVTPGEVVVPKRLQHPEFLTALHLLARAHSIDPATLRVGSGSNTINPRTGQMEFDDGDDEDFGDLGNAVGQNPTYSQIGDGSSSLNVPNYSAFDPGTYDPGNFNVNDLSQYATPNSSYPSSGIGYSGQGLLGSPGSNSSGLLASPPISQGAGQPQYVDSDGNPIEGITVTASQNNPNPTNPSGNPLTFRGDATYYDLPGNTTKSGQPFDRNANAAAMFQPGKINIGDTVTVQLQKPPYTTITVPINDGGPYLRDPNGKPQHPLQPDPVSIIDLTPRAFTDLTGDKKLGRVPVIVTKIPGTKGP